MTDHELADSAAAGFAVLSDPVRVRILLALAETRQYSWDQRGMSYSDLRNAVDIEDGGRFNYHLDKLRGEFVDSKDGHYWLSMAGWRIVDTVYGRTLTDNQSDRSGTLSYRCPSTDEPLQATVANGVIEVTCPEYGTVFDMPLPLSVAADPTRDLDAIYEYAFKRAHQYAESVRMDVCPHCGGRFDEPTVAHNTDSYGSGLTAGYTCRQCAVAFQLPIEDLLWSHPAVVAFFADHGFDTTTPSLISQADAWGVSTVELQAGFVVEFSCSGECLTLELDSALEVVSTSLDPLSARTGEDSSVGNPAS